jgi:hypothetical protein
MLLLIHRSDTIDYRSILRICIRVSIENDNQHKHAFLSVLNLTFINHRWAATIASLPPNALLPIPVSHSPRQSLLEIIFSVPPGKLPRPLRLFPSSPTPPRFVILPFLRPLEFRIIADADGCLWRASTP